MSIEKYTEDNKFENLESFAKYYNQTICVGAFCEETRGGQYKEYYRKETDSIKRQAIEKGALEIAITLEMLCERSKKDGTDSLKLLPISKDVFKEAENLFEDWGIESLKTIYPYIVKAYGEELPQAHTQLLHKAIEDDNYQLLYFIESIKSTSQDSKTFEEQMDNIESDFADPSNIYSVVSRIYAQREVSPSQIRQKLLLDIIESMDMPKKQVEEKYIGFAEIEIPDRLLQDLGWNVDIPDKIIEGKTPGFYKSDELLAQEEAFFDMGNFLNNALNYVGVSGFRFLITHPNFKKIFEVNQERFAEKMAISQRDSIRLEFIKYLSEEQYEIYKKDYETMISNFEYAEVIQNLEYALKAGNLKAFSLLMHSECLNINASEDVPDTIFWHFAQLLDIAFRDDNPEAIEMILESGFLFPEDVAHLSSQFDREEVKENLYLALPSMLERAIEESDIAKFDLVLNLAGVEFINMAINEQGETPFQIALATGNSLFAKHILEAYLTDETLQEEAITALNASGENALHNVSPAIDMDILNQILKMAGVKDAIEHKVDNAESARDALTPILSIIDYHVSEGSEIIKLYAEAGANIFATDKNGRDMGDWVALVSEGDESHPLYNIYSKFEADEFLPVEEGYNKKTEAGKIQIDIEYVKVNDEDSDSDGLSRSSSITSASSGVSRCEEIFQTCHLVPHDFGQSSESCIVLTGEMHFSTAFDGVSVY